MSTYTCPDGHTSTSDDYCDVCGAPIGAGAAAAAASSAGASSAGASSAGAGAASVAAGAGSAAAGGAGPASALPPPLPAAGGLLDLGPGPLPTVPVPAGRACPNCSATNPADALFCEDCGYDFTTGQLPRSTPATPDLAPLAPPAGAPGGAPSGPVEWVAEVWVDPDWHAAQDSADPCPSPGMPVVVPLVGTSLLVGRTSASRSIHPQVDISTDTGVSRRHAQLTTDGQRWWVEDLQSANGTYVSTSGGPLPTQPVTPGQREELADDDRIYLGAWTRLVLRRATPQEQTASA